MQTDEKFKLVKKSLIDITKFDSVLREYEFPDIVVEAEISEAAYAQLKRQRMMTIIKQPETADIGYVIPQNVMAVGKAQEYANSYEQSRKLFEDISKNKNRHIALYALPLSNITRVYFKTNLRELHSMARHREDAAAQWEIREMQKATDTLAKEKMPLSTMLLCGKDTFDNNYNHVFGTQG
jgi:hypothetical protein